MRAVFSFKFTFLLNGYFTSHLVAQLVGRMTPNSTTPCRAVIHLQSERICLGPHVHPASLSSGVKQSYVSEESRGKLPHIAE